MKAKQNVMKFFLLLIVVILITVLSGCTTSIARTKLYTGVSSAQMSYTAVEAGTHWIRPQELTYEPREVVDFETQISLSSNNYIQEAVIFGYPQPGKAANPFITRAISEAIVKYRADGFLVTTYSIEHKDDYNDSAHVSIHGRPLELVDLGEVAIDRADQERFITRIVVEENPGQDFIKTTTTTTPVALQNLQGLIAFPKVISTRATLYLTPPIKRVPPRDGRFWVGPQEYSEPSC